MNVRIHYVICFVLLATHLQAADWTEFRGPSKQGKLAESNLPTTWSSTKNVRWRTELPGEGWSSPVVIGSSIYLTAAIERGSSDDSKTYELAAIILDVESGAVVKRIPLFTEDSGAPRIHKKNSRASPTPVYDGENIFVHFGHQGTACISKSGELIWKNDSLDYPPVHGNGGSPVIVDNLLIFSRDGADISEVTALDKRTGKIAWQTTRDVDVKKQFSFCTPLVLDIDGRRQLILPGSNVVQSLDPATGREHWRVTYDGYSVIPRPIYESGLVFISTGYDRPSLLAIDPTGSGDVTETHVRWREEAGIAHTPSFIGADGKVMTVSDRGIATCFDARSGKELWKERIGGNFSASPILAGKLLYLLSEEGDCTILDVAGAPKVVAKNSMGERSLASLAVVDHDLLLRTDAALYRITK